MSNDPNCLQEPLRTIVNKVLAEGQGRITVSSSCRTRAEQQVLYNDYLNGNGPLAARPGSSNHEFGMAVDFGGDVGLAAQLGAKYGLVLAVPGENWHFELGPDVPMPEGFQGNISYDINHVGLDGLPMDPQEALANRIAMIANTLGMDTVGQARGYTTVQPGPGSVDSPSMYQAMPLDVDQGLTLPAQEVMQVEGGAPVTGDQAAAPTELQQYAGSLLGQYGWDASELAPLITLWNKESGWNPNAQNPTSTAFGIAQFLNGTWAGTGFEKTADPHAQIQAGLKYIQARYGSPSMALQFHFRNNWY